MIQLLAVANAHNDVEGYCLYLSGMDDHEPEDCDDDWNALVAEIEELPLFKTRYEARQAYSNLNLHGYARQPLVEY